METTLITILGFTNVILLVALLLNRKIKVHATKNSDNHRYLIGALQRFKQDIVMEPKSDGSTHLTFPVTVLGNSLHFYVHPHEDGKVLLSDNGEIVSKLNLVRTMNKNVLKKVDSRFGVRFNPGNKSLEYVINQNELDYGIWMMYSALLVIEYVRYN